MRRVYVAGPYSADDVLKVFDNMRKGIRASIDVLLAGFAPFCPWLDYQFSLMLYDHEKLTVEQYYAYSIAWLEVADAVLVLPGFETSKGTMAEIMKAEALDIPIFYNIEELKEWKG
ncbi:MAG: DUF4406 domain-containing protein [Dehalococcoidales bacterium]|jgi:nucleoside 2-deoxyribosyltransferase